MKASDVYLCLALFACVGASKVVGQELRVAAQPSIQARVFQAADPLLGESASEALGQLGVPNAASVAGCVSSWSYHARGGTTAQIWIYDHVVVKADPEARRAVSFTPIPENGAYIGQPVAELARRLGNPERTTVGDLTVDLDYAQLRVTVAHGRVIELISEGRADAVHNRPWPLWAERPSPETKLVDGLYEELVDREARVVLRLIPAVRPFYMGKYEVTAQQYGENGTYPAAKVRWDDAVKWCRQRGFRLPTPAEWDYAASGGVKTQYWWGDIFRADAENLGARPLPVGGTGRCNMFGLYDMLGNVAEWVDRRTLDFVWCRGGYYGHQEPPRCAIGYGNQILRKNGYPMIGFRVVRDL
ncbi:MAG: SUMF1/EgtB/PvdO family nonheme iron enzyme [Planctomycetota bacterium]